MIVPCSHLVPKSNLMAGNFNIMSSLTPGIVLSFVAGLLAISELVQAQNRSTSMVHLDKPYYVAGEMINYQVYLPPNLSQKETLLEVAIYNGTGEIIASSYLKNGVAILPHGYYKIPYDLTPGIYRLVVKLQEDSDYHKISIASAVIPVYATSIPAREIDQLSLSNTSTKIDTDFDLNISIEVLTGTIKPRDQVQLKIEVNDKSGNPVKANASISVTDIVIIGADSLHSYQTLYLSSPVPVSPDLLGQSIAFSGQLESGESDELLTFYLPSYNRIYYATTEDGGRFQLVLPEFYGEQSLNYIGQFSDGVRVKFMEDNLAETQDSLVYTKAITTYIEESKKRRNIYQLFNRTELSYQFTTPDAISYIEPDREYHTPSYPFQDLPAFCKGLSTQLKYVKNKQDGYQFKMFNPESRNFFFGTPLFIVDGQLTKDVEYLTALDFTALEKIMLYYDNLRLSNNFGFAGFGGVVVLVSKDGELKVPESSSTQEFRINGLQAVPSLLESVDEDPRMPMFKPQLLWKPALVTDSVGGVEISFQQSDDISRFQIEVVAQSEDGRYGYEKYEYHSQTPW